MNLDRSPYAAPESNLDSFAEKAVARAPVGRWTRFANYLIDYITMLATMILIFFAIGLLVGEQGIDQFEEKLDAIPDIVFGIGMYLVYYLPFEALTGRTLGKLITGTRIISEDGSIPTFGQVFGRTLCRLIPFEPFSFFRQEGRGWHDTMVKIHVVKCR